MDKTKFKDIEKKLDSSIRMKIGIPEQGRPVIPA